MLLPPATLRNKCAVFLPSGAYSDSRFRDFIGDRPCRHNNRTPLLQLQILKGKQLFSAPGGRSGTIQRLSSLTPACQGSSPKGGPSKDGNLRPAILYQLFLALEPRTDQCWCIVSLRAKEKVKQHQHSMSRTKQWFDEIHPWDCVSWDSVLRAATAGERNPTQARTSAHEADYGHR